MLESFFNSLEKLESRELLSITLDNGLLTITGTDGPDKVLIAEDDDTGDLHIQLQTPDGTTDLFVPQGEPVNSVQIQTLGGNDVVVVASDVDDWIDSGGAFALLIDTGSGNDRVVIGGGFTLNAFIDAGDGNDRVKSGAGDDEIHGGDGNDWIHSGRGDDDLFGEDGRDRLKGGSGSDAIDGGLGFDLLWGLSGSDTLFGQSGDDRLFGNGGHDILIGGDGRDILKGGGGKDTVDSDASDRKTVGAEYEREITFELMAVLAPDVSDWWGRARFRFKMEQEHGEFELKAVLQVFVSTYSPNTTLDIALDGQTVGTVTTDAYGNGWAQFKFELEQEHGSESPSHPSDDDHEDEHETEHEDDSEH